MRHQIEDYFALPDELDTIESNGEIVGFQIPPDDKQSPELRIMLLEEQVEFWQKLVRWFVRGEVQVEMSPRGQIERLTFPSEDGTCRNSIEWSEA
jgi:hypothetical protein